MTDTNDVTQERIAQRLGLNSADIELLTGPDAFTMLTQGQRLADMDSAELMARSNVAPREGDTVQTFSSEQDVREFARELFGREE